MDECKPLTDDLHAADCILLNTCAIREKAEDKIWHRLRQLKVRRCRLTLSNPR